MLAAYLFFPAAGRPLRRTAGGARAGPCAPRCGRNARAVGRGWCCRPGRRVRGRGRRCVFFVARYGNEAFEQTPRGELTAMNYLYAHDSAGIRAALAERAPPVDDTPQMPWQYRDIEKIRLHRGVKAPVNPAAVAGAGRRRCARRAPAAT